MSEGADHIVLAKNMKAQQLDQVLALLERGIQHDQPRSFVRKTKSQPEEIQYHRGQLRGFGVLILHQVDRRGGNLSLAMLADRNQPLVQQGEKGRLFAPVVRGELLIEKMEKTLQLGVRFLGESDFLN